MHPLLEELVRPAVWLRDARRDRRRWRAGGAEPRVFYGFEHLPAADEFTHGGIIKTQDLQQRFPNQPRDANLLYLVSSCLPLFAPRHIRYAQSVGAPFVLNQNGVAYGGWYGRGWEQYNIVARRVLQSADVVIYQSVFCRDTADRFLGPARGRSEILHNPVDTTMFVPAVKDPAPGNFVILLAGSHGAFYRVQAAVDALVELRPRLPEARLIIAGRCAWRRRAPEAQAELQAYAQQRGVAEALELAGPYAQTGAVALLQRAHVLLHPKYNDPCPRLVVEAMACGLPVVYSATGGVPELVCEGAGVGVPGPLDFEHDHPPSPSALAEALHTVARQRVTFAAAARRHAVARLDVQPWLRRHAEIFQQVLTK